MSHTLLKVFLFSSSQFTAQDGGQGSITSLAVRCSCVLPPRPRQCDWCTTGPGVQPSSAQPPPRQSCSLQTHNQPCNNLHTGPWTGQRCRTMSCSHLNVYNYVTRRVLLLCVWTPGWCQCQTSGPAVVAGGCREGDPNHRPAFSLVQCLLELQTKVRTKVRNHGQGPY